VAELGAVPALGAHTREIMAEFGRAASAD
jgi:hypothetical protein